MCRRATKLVPSLKQLSYTDGDRLKKLKMQTLKYRRLRGDMIETFKIVNGIDDKDVTERFFEMSRTDQSSGHSKKIAGCKADHPARLCNLELHVNVITMWLDVVV
jgi:hypothetical protein